MFLRVHLVIVLIIYSYPPFPSLPSPSPSSPPPQVRFLEYIRQWRKKVVFVVNKVDMLGSADEVEEVKRWVEGGGAGSGARRWCLW